MNRPGRTLNLLTRASALVEWLAINLQCRVHRWHLFNCAGQRFHRLGQFEFCELGGRCFGNHRAIGVGGFGTHTQDKGALVPLVRIEQKLRELGGLTETQRQYPCCQRIKTACMASLGGPKKALGLLERCIR